MKVLLDKSTIGQKGLGRFTETLIICLKKLPLRLDFYSRKGPIYHPLAYFNIVNKYDWDVYITPHFIVPLNILLTGKPIYITIHDVIPFTKFNLRFLLLFFFLRIILKFKNIKVFTPSNTSKEKIKKIFQIDKRKIFVINNQAKNIGDLYKNNFKDNIPKDHDLHILYIGNLKEHKNVQLLIKACNFVNANKNRKIRLSIVAGFDTQSSVRYKLPLNSDFINVYGDLSDKEIRQLIENCDYLIQPSFDEGFGIPVMEALINNKKVICSDIDIFHELYEDYVIFVNHYDPVILAEILINNYGSTNTKNINLITEKYSLENIKNQLSNALGL